MIFFFLKNAKYVSLFLLCWTQFSFVCFVIRAYSERLLSNPRVTLHMLHYYIRSFIHERMISIQAVKVHSLNEKKM